MGLGAIAASRKVTSLLPAAGTIGSSNSRLQPDLRSDISPPGEHPTEGAGPEGVAFEYEVLARMNRIGRQTAYAMLVILVLAIVWQVLGTL